eukprot:269300-Pelagomonas_calceolata.AAC.20
MMKDQFVPCGFLVSLACSTHANSPSSNMSASCLPTGSKAPGGLQQTERKWKGGTVGLLCLKCNKCNNTEAFRDWRQRCFYMMLTCVQKMRLLRLRVGENPST